MEIKNNLWGKLTSGFVHDVTHNKWFQEETARSKRLSDKKNNLVKEEHFVIPMTVWVKLELFENLRQPVAWYLNGLTSLEKTSQKCWLKLQEERWGLQPAAPESDQMDAVLWHQQRDLFHVAT